MSAQVEHFARAAERFCSWAEAEPSGTDAEVLTALGHLSDLYQLVLGLPELFDEQEPPEVLQESWERVYARFASMPFNYYSQCFDPQELDSTPVVADLADDLADVWRDLKRGLLLFHAGHTASACWEWRESFWQHWGQHATASLHALHSWRSQYG